MITADLRVGDPHLVEEHVQQPAQVPVVRHPLHPAGVPAGLRLEQGGEERGGSRHGGAHHQGPARVPAVDRAPAQRRHEGASLLCYRRGGAWVPPDHSALHHLVLETSGELSVNT